MSLLRSRATTTMLQRSAGVFRHDGRTTQPDVNRSEAGDTLIEILIAMLILGVATLSLLAAFATSISASATHRSIATFDTVIRSAAQQAISQIQQQPDPLYVSCASASYYQTGSGAVQFTLPTGFAAQVTSVQYWNGSSFTTSQSQCTADSPEWITISVSNSAGQSYTNNFIVDDPYAPPIPANGNAYQLVFLQEPAGATTANNFTTQPVVAVEDDTGHVVTTDLSSVTLTITPNTGTSGANLSQYCTGVETSGVITFSDCSIDTAGLDYQLTATDPGLVSAISTAFNVYTQLGTPVITAANPSSTETGAINVVFSGSSNAPAGQTYTATACANSGVGFGCVTQNNFTSGSDVTGLVPGTQYYVTVTANAPTPLYLLATSSASGPVMATLQLNAPGTPTLAYGTVAGSVQVTFSTPTPAATGQLYTAFACTNAAMTTGCVSGTVSPGGNLTGLPYTSGSAGSSYYVDLYAAASSGYLASSDSGVGGPQAAESSINPPTNLSVAPSTTTAGAISVTFTASSGGQAPSSYTLTLCQDAAMSIGCTTRTISAGTTVVTGLTQGTGYYAQVTANSPSAGFAPSSTSVVGPALATTQLSAPTAITPGFGSVAGSITANFAPPTNASASQTYTLEACTNAAMTTGCVTNVNYSASQNLTGLSYTQGSAGTSYWVTVTANGSSGYFVSSPSAATGPQAATSKVDPPGTPSSVTSSSGGGAITITFTSSLGVAPAGYTATACTNSSMTANCVTGAITSGGTLTGLNGGSTYYVQITAVGATGFVNALSGVSASSTLASTQLATPQITAVTPSTTTAGVLSISFTEQSPPFGQTYSAIACTNAAMTTGCVTQAPYTSGAAFLLLTAGNSYYVTITANASAGYVAATSAVVGPTLAPVQLATPGTPTLTYGSVAGSIAVTVSSSNAPAGQLYTVKLCTNITMLFGCTTDTNVASGSNATGLNYNPGSAGTSYYVDAYAQASAGYLQSGTSGIAGPQAATSVLGSPGTPNAASSTTTAGAVTASFSNSSGPTVASYTANACTNSAMTQNCVTVTNYTSGSQLTGLTSGSTYYVQITAVSSSTAYAASNSGVSGSVLATVQLGTPAVTLASSTTTAGAITVTFSAPTGAPGGQSYTAVACTNAAMTTGCVTKAGYSSGASINGLTAGANYYVQLTAVASSGYLAASSAVTGPVLATLQLTTPGTPTLAYGTVAGSIAVTVSSSNAPAGQLYTIKACTNSSMFFGCVTDSNVLSGGNATGLVYTAGSAGTAYYVDAYAQASSGYLQSNTSGTAGPQVDTSSLKAPTNLATASSLTTVGALVATFTASSGVAPSGYTAIACTDSLMTQNCVTYNNYTSSTQFTGLVAGTSYYVTITANSSNAAYASATTAAVGPTLASTQLGGPSGVTLGYGSVAGSLQVTFTGSSNPAAGQTYTAEGCTNVAMTTGCVTNANFVSGSNLTGLAFTPGVAGANFYVTVAANASSGYLGSGPSSVTGPQADTSELGIPGTPTVASSTLFAGAITAAFTSSSGVTPSSYTVEACTNAAMSSGCLSQTDYASGAQIQPLTEGTSYYAQITAVSISTAFVSSTSATSISSAVATTQLVAPTITAAAPSSTTSGAITVTFTGSPNAPGGQTYTVTACTDQAMTQNCVSQAAYTSGAQFSGLSQSTSYYVTVRANASNAYLSNTSSPPFGPVGSTAQLTTPTNVVLAYGSVAGSIEVSFTGSTNAPGGQTYTVKACTNAGMTSGCVTNANFTSASNLTSLLWSQGSAGTSYYVTVTANASTGYIASAPSAAVGPQGAESEVNAPGTPSVVASTTTPGAVVATFTSSTGTAPSSYTATACTNAAMTTACVSLANYTSGAQLTGLTAASSYYVQITANGPTGFLSTNSAVSASSALASTQLAAPTNVTLAFGSVAGSIQVTFTSSANAAGGQTYTVKACTNAGMTTGCVTNANYASGANLTGLGWSQGSAGTNYYVTVTANASTGYLASAATAVAGPQGATSQVSAPGTPSVVSSPSTAGAVTATFTASSGVAPASYTAIACTNGAMTTNCVTLPNFTSGTALTGLTGGSSYYVEITAVGATGYLSATSGVSSPAVLATIQLNAPTNVTLAYGTVAGSIKVTFTASSNAAGGQSYTATACTNSAMTTGCVTNATYTSGSNLAGLLWSQGSAGTNYYVTIIANASTGFLASPATAVAGPQGATSQVSAPGTPSVASSSSAAGAITATFTASSGVAPASYTAIACTNSAMTTGCVSLANYTSGANLTGLTQGSSYYVEITAVGGSGFLSATSGVSAAAVVASTQLALPTITSVAPSTTTAGQLTINFTGSSNAPGGQSYTATACTNSAMTAGCATQTGYTSGAQFTGLSSGTSYYVTITAVATTAYLASTSNSTGPTLATVQLGLATITSVAPSASASGALSISFSAPSNAPGGQTYTAIACTNTAMTAGCVTQSNYTSGANVTGLSGGASYYVEITSNLSIGYLASTTADVGPTMATAQLNAPTGVGLAYGATAGSIQITFTGSSNAPGGQTYTAKACTNSGMTTGCITNSSFTSGSQFTGLNCSPGSAGTGYYVTVTANASSGYLQSAASSVAGAQNATSQVNAANGFTASPSTTTAGSVTATFSAPSGTAPSSYTAIACIDLAMTTGCVTVNSYTSGAQISGLTADTNYYVQVTSNPPTGYVSAQTAVSSATQATVALSAPTGVSLAYGSAAGSVQVTFTAPLNAAAGQTYAAKACTNSGMTTACVSNANFTSGNNLTGLNFTVGSAGTAYYVTVTANAQSGYLASAASTVAGPQAETSQVGAPTGFSASSSATTAGAVTAAFSAPTGTAPSSYTATACTNSAMTAGCVTVNNYTTGTQITGLTQGTTYYVQITANPPTGYASAQTAVSSGVLATTQLSAPTGVTLAYGSAAGSVQVTFTAPSNAAAGQTYTAKACTNSGMTTACISNANFTSGSNLTGLTYALGSAGTAYYVSVTANALTGYLVSTASTVAGPQAATSEVNAPTTVSVTKNSNLNANLNLAFTASTGTAPASYTAVSCTNSAMTTGCVTETNVTNGTVLTGLSANTKYYVEVTAIGPTGYVSDISAQSSATTGF